MTAPVRTRDQLEVLFNSLVAAAIEEFGSKPRREVEECDDGTIELMASVTTKKEEKTILGGYGKVTIGDSNVLTVTIEPGEIEGILELLESYEQSDDGFEEPDFCVPARNPQTTLDMIPRRS